MKLPIASKSTIRQHLAQLLAHHAGEFTVVIILQLLASVSMMAIPWIVGRTVDEISRGTTLEAIELRIIQAVVAVTMGALLAFFAEYRSRVLGEKLYTTLRNDLVRSLIHLPLSTVENAGTGDLMGRTTHDIDEIQFMVRNGVSQILILISTLLTGLGAAIATSPLLSLVFMCEVPLMWLLMNWYLPRTVPSYRTMGAILARLSGVVHETIDNAETVDSSHLADQRFGLLDSATQDVLRVGRYGAWMRVFLLSAGLFIALSPIFGVVILGAWAMPYGWVTLGQVTAVALYANQLRQPVMSVTFWIDQIQSAQASLSRIFGVSEVLPDRQPTGEEPHDTRMNVDQVSYAYRRGHNVLHDVSLSLTSGETLAMVGPSGAGKSTLGRMLAGIHPPTSGGVTVGGVNLVDLDEKTLHRQVVLVTQEHHVFVGSIADNLRLARSEATDEQLWDALDAVEASQWVRDMSDGLDTRVGSDAMVLSPGRAQQLALARIVLMDPHTLILDEATSLMDPTAARSVEQSLNSVLHGRTVVAIAHRLYTAHDASRIAVMLDGQIAELGTHDELIARGGEYASLWDAWQKE